MSELAPLPIEQAIASTAKKVDEMRRLRLNGAAETYLADHAALLDLQRRGTQWVERVGLKWAAARRSEASKGC